MPSTRVPVIRITAPMPAHRQARPAMVCRRGLQRGEADSASTTSGGRTIRPIRITMTCGRISAGIMIRSSIRYTHSTATAAPRAQRTRRASAASWKTR